MGATSIEWTNVSWNPIRGCSRVSAGCEQCYAEGVAARFSGVHPKTGKPLSYHGLARRSGKGLPLWTGEVRMVPEHLADPLRWRTPRKVFVNSMSDLFHEKLTNEQIAAVFGVMMAAPDHTFQCLTKRARRMREWFGWVAEHGGLNRYIRANWADLRDFYAAGSRFGEYRGKRHRTGDDAGAMVLNASGCSRWPLENVHLGVSAENQETADERIPDLLACPAEVRWVSAEPLIGPVDFDAIQIPGAQDGLRFSALTHQHDARFGTSDNLLNWVVIGGESGSKSRPFDLAWGRDIIQQCKAADVPVFMKQMGSCCRFPSSNVTRVIMPPGTRSKMHTVGLANTFAVAFEDSHGGDPAEWPEEFRVREFPSTHEQRAKRDTRAELRGPVRGEDR